MSTTARAGGGGGGGGGIMSLNENHQKCLITF